MGGGKQSTHSSSADDATVTCCIGDAGGAEELLHLILALSNYLPGTRIFDQMYFIFNVQNDGSILGT